MGVTRACGLGGISRSLYRYASCRSPTLELRNRIAKLAAMKRRYGYRGFMCCCAGRAGR